MPKGLKGITVVIDGKTDGLNKALEKTNSESRSLTTELKGVNSLLKFDPKNTELLAQKQIVLSQSIEQTENKLKTLILAQKQMQEAGKNADNSEEYRDLQREIIKTQQSLKGFNTQLKNTQVQQKQAAREAETLGQKIYKIASHIPGVKKIASGFVQVKGKIKEAVKEGKTIQSIGPIVENVKDGIEAFKNAHPQVRKVADEFKRLKERIREVKEELPETKNLWEKVGNTLQTVGKGGFKVLETTIGGTMKAFAAFSTTVLTAGAAAIKKAIGGYGDYEQLVGGIETLFGAGGQSIDEYAKSVGKTTQEVKKEYDNLLSAQEIVLKNADNAYKTAGLSANDYMETVTGFSAALINSLDGDTKAAAQKADMAITDMADNANKMGSDISSIQNAYQGFAKQNYTMLDNLKIGYGGTKEEMQRLLDDATKLSDVEYSISSYADIVDAIHVIQTEMGITGTTAKEASETIQGSANATKSAFENLMTGLANEDADLDNLINNLTESVLTLADNVIPRVIETVPRMIGTIPKLISGLIKTFKKLSGQLSGVLTEQILPALQQAFFTLIKAVISSLPTLLPEILKAGTLLFGGLLQGLNEIIPQMTEILPDIIQTISQTIMENLPQLVTAGAMVLVNLISGLTQTLPTLIETAINLMPVIVQAIMDNLPLIIDAGLTLLLSFASGIVQAIPQLIEMLPTIINTIVTTIVTMLPKIIETGIQLLNSLISGIVQAIPLLIAMLPEIISSTINTIVANLPKIIQTGIELLGALISGIVQAIPALVAALPQIFVAIFDAFGKVNWAELGVNIISGVINGVKSMIGSLLDVFADMANSALDKVKETLGIASPSKVMRDQVGKMIPAGIAVGVEDGMQAEEQRIKAAITRGVPTTIDSYIKSGSRHTGSESTAAAAGGIVQNLTINSPRELSPSETARLNRNAFRQMILKLNPT